MMQKLDTHASCFAGLDCRARASRDPPTPFDRLGLWSIDRWGMALGCLAAGGRCWLGVADDRSCVASLSCMTARCGMQAHASIQRTRAAHAARGRRPSIKVPAIGVRLVRLIGSLIDPADSSFDLSINPPQVQPRAGQQAARETMGIDAASYQKNKETIYTVRPRCCGCGCEWLIDGLGLGRLGACHAVVYDGCDYAMHTFTRPHPHPHARH